MKTSLKSWDIICMGRKILHVDQARQLFLLVQILFHDFSAENDCLTSQFKVCHVHLLQTICQNATNCQQPTKQSISHVTRIKLQKSIACGPQHCSLLKLAQITNKIFACLLIIAAYLEFSFNQIHRTLVSAVPFD